MKPFKFNDKSLENIWKIVEYLMDKVDKQEEKIKLQEQILQKLYEYNAGRLRKDKPQGVDQG